MAIYHLHVKTGSRSKGQSAKAKSDYITRSGKYSRDSDEVMFSRSGNMPSWVDQPDDYWKAADTYERKNGTLYREIEFSLPVELSLDQQRELATGFAEMLTRNQQLPFTFAIHGGKGHNPHCHLMISEKIGDGIDRSPQLWFKRHNSKKPEKGGAKKADISSRRKKWLEDTRKGWADLANFALERAGFDERIDHRSLIDRGIDRVPEIHIGQNAMALERKGIITDRGQEFMEIQEVNAEYERLKRAAEQQNERERDPSLEPEVGSPAERKRPVNRQREKVVDTREQFGKKDDLLEESKPRSSVWNRVRNWFADRFFSRDDEQVNRADKPVESDELKMLKRRIRMTPEERVLADRDRLNERLENLRDRDKSQADDYARSLEVRPRSPAPDGRSREM